MRRVLFVLAVLVLSSVPASAGGDLEQWVDDLGAVDSSRRIAAWHALRKAKDERAIPLLLAKLPAFSLYGQQYGVMVLESYPPKVVKRTIPKLLEMESPYLRLCAGFDLFHLGDKRGVPAMVEALQADGVDLSMRMYMVNRLYNVREPRVLAVLEGMLVSGMQTSLLGSVLWALHTAPGPSTLEACRRLREADDRADVRFLTAIFLFRNGEVEQARDAADALRTGEVTSIAFSRMRSFLQTARLSAPPVLLEAATELVVADTQAGLLRTVIDYLAAAGHRAVVPRLHKLVGHESAIVAKAVFEALAALGADFDQDALRPLLDTEDAERRLAAADILRRMDDLSGLPAVLDVLKTGEVLHRREAARLLGTFRVRAAVDPLLDGLMDEDATVRGNALRSLDLVWRNLFPYRRLDLVAAGYAASDAEAPRKAAAARIRAWWQAHRGGDW